MTRLAVTAIRDIRLLWRNGFVYAAGVVAAVLIALLHLLPDRFADWLLPVALIGNFVMNGFYFGAGMMLLERAERTLDVQFVTPLRSTEYVGAKIIALSLLSLLEALVIVLASGHDPGRYLLLSVGTVAMTAILCQVGLLMITRYESINRFLMPSVLVTYVLVVPMVDLLDLWEGRWLYLHPLYPPMVVLEGAFRSVSALELGVALALTAFWLVAGLALTQRVIRRFATTP